MKHLNIILSILFWSIASMCMAIKLPTSSYTSDYLGGTDSPEFQLGTGITMKNTSFLAAAANIDVNVCTWEGIPRNPNDCSECCEEYFLSGTVYDKKSFLACTNSCEQGKALGEPETPAGEVLILVPFALTYAGFMNYRRRRKNAEQA